MSDDLLAWAFKYAAHIERLCKVELWVGHEGEPHYRPIGGWK